MSRLYEIRVIADLDQPADVDALFDRVADAAHRDDEPVVCSGNWIEVEDE